MIGEINVLARLKDARTLINDGCNERGTFLSGESCKACVRWIDEALLQMLKEQEPQTEINGKCPRCGWDFENGELDFSHLNSKNFIAQIADRR